MPQIFLASDHRGFAQKERIMAHFGENFSIVDLGPDHYDQEDDFNDASIKVAKSIQQNPGSFGILLCGSAHGIAIQANRFKGIRAICAYNTHLAEIGRQHNDANVLCMSADLMNDQTIDEVIAKFFSTEFLAEERFIRRNQRLDEEN